MKLYLYVTKNKKSGQYGQIKAEIMDNDQAKESYSISKLEAPVDQQKYLNELELYCLGSYDTASGQIVSNDPVFLLDLGAVTYGKENKNN